MDKLVILSGNGNPTLARGIASHLGLSLCAADVGSFDDGECRVRIMDDVRGKHVVIVQPTNQPDRNQTELELMVRAVKNSAQRVTVIIPYLGYSRQDRKTVAREPISVVQRLRNIIGSGIDAIVLHDIHDPRLPAVCEGIDEDLAVDSTISRPVFLDWLMTRDLSNAIISSIDAGGAKMVESYWTRLRAMGYPVEFGIAHKSGTSSSGISGIKLLGDFQNRDAYFIDDMVTTAKTAVLGAVAAKQAGARTAHFVGSHGVVANDGVAQRIADSPFDTFTVTNTIAMRPEHREVLRSKLNEVPLDPLLALIIRHLHMEKSLSKLFELDGYRECLSELQTT